MTMRVRREYILMMGLAWAACFVLFALAYFFVISPQLGVKARLARESAEKKQMCEVAINIAKEDSKKKLSDEVKGLKSKLSGYAVDSEESANLTLNIGRIAADKRVSSFAIKSVDQIMDAGQVESGYLQENYVEVTFKSGFNQFATFLNALERHQPVIFVNKFKVLRGGRDDKLNTVDMGISIFVRKQADG